MMEYILLAPRVENELGQSGKGKGSVLQPATHYLISVPSKGLAGRVRIGRSVFF